MPVYIQAVSQISIQQPLSDKWIDNPIFPNQPFVESLDPDYKQYIPPMQARRMGKLLKRALTTSADVLKKSNLHNVDAIISGTGLGCIDNTEKFLNAIINNDEQFLQPTFFMQSTHNTISSQIALSLKCNGYNSTYSHLGTSFDSALLDAFMQFELNQINSALVGSHDEMTPDYFNMLGKIGYWKNGIISEEVLRKADSEGSFSGSCSVSLLLNGENNANSLCSIDAVEMLYKPSMEKLNTTLQKILLRNNLTINDIDAVMMDFNGSKSHDNHSHQVADTLFPQIPLLWYKHLFGESFSSSAFGIYTTAIALHQAAFPINLFYSKPVDNFTPQHILVFHQFRLNEYVLIFLSSC